MLEFQEGFFEQEVRDGFYLDVTIKTLWASEMELLNKVAEVCGKYGLKWYAAYGTLLGAIRHEGFVPWDDDMDIWMMRKDYNKLMKVLPEELPEGYRVRGPQTEEGYDQFHTCVNNGSGISIEKKWMEENHNCPFTVGLDIFPLDYLPRNKKDREMQQNLFILVGRVAQVAKNIGRGDYDVDEATMTKSEAIREVKDGLKYLKKNYKFSIDKKWLEEEKWDKITSEVWKWGNYVAAMYGEDESDYIVEYLDWTRWSWKKYPKEWFAEQYSATFENFMVPIPCGYDEVLKTIYADYMYFQPKTGSHEYPFYARQLKQLREYVKDVEQRAENLGVISIDEIVIQEEYHIPEVWKPLTLRRDGSQKKIILMANNSSEYQAFGNEALDKLSLTLQYFKSISEDVLLWWRPLPMMEKILNQQNEELGKRYLSILDEYRQSGWGICDEQEEAECAVEFCDAYYGEMNAVVQRMQNYPKPVMISQRFEKEYMEEYFHRRILESRAFLSYTDYVEKDGKLYFSNSGFNALVIVDQKTGKVEDITPFEGCALTEMNLHVRCVCKEGRILFLPSNQGVAHIYDIQNKKQFAIPLMEMRNVRSIDYWTYFECDDEVYILPGVPGGRLWKWNIVENSIQEEKWWDIGKEEVFLFQGKYNKTSFYSLKRLTNQLYITDVKEKLVRRITLPDPEVADIAFDGTYFWYIMEEKNTIIKWREGSNHTERYAHLTCEYYFPREEKVFLTIRYMLGKIFLTSQNGNTIYILNPENGVLESQMDFSPMDNTFRNIDKNPFLYDRNGKLVYLMRRLSRRVDIDFENGTVTETEDEIQLNDTAKAMVKRIMVARKVLLLENENFGLEDYMSCLQ